MKIAVLGVYQTKFGELWDKSLEDLMFEATLGAIKDAGIKKDQIETAFVGNKLAGKMAHQNHLGALFYSALKLNIPVVRVEAACASGGAAIHQACLAIASGMYETALVVGVEKMTDLPPELVVDALMDAASGEERAAGLSFVGLYALLAKYYCEQFGIKAEDLSQAAVKNHFHASLNEKAHFSFEIKKEDVAASPMVSSPLRLLDCSPISDGAAAVVLSSKTFAKKLKRKQVFIIGSAQATDTLSLSQRSSLLSLEATRQAKDKAFTQAGVACEDINLMEVHDCFSVAEILALEDLGFYPKGEGWQPVGNGEARLGGKRPVNLSGGLKACGHPVGATGVKQIVEIFNQIERRAGKRQTKKATVGLAHNVGGSGGTAVVHILSK
jgi:acetyl-CoA C-acetyltransferase